MKRHITKSRSLCCLALCASASVALAQGPGGPGGNGGPGGGQNQGGGPNGNFRPPPVPPIIRALDVNRDGIIDSNEINNAAKELRTLETGTADQLTIPQLLGPPRRRGPGGGPQGQMRGGPGGGGPGGGGPQGQNAQGGGQQGQNGGPGGNQRPPPPPVIRALDMNHDGIIDSNEINNAPQELRTLETGTVDQLTVPQLLGPPRHRGMGGPGGPGGRWGQNNGGNQQNAGGPPGGGQAGPGGGNDGNPPPPPPPPNDTQQANPPPPPGGGNGDDGAPPPPPPQQ